MSDEHLIKMANDIAAFFGAEPNHDEAVGGVVNHISKFWTPRMRDKLSAHLRDGGAGLTDLALEAARRIAAQRGAKDAGKLRA